MKKTASRFTLLVCLIMVLTLVFSTMAWAAESSNTGKAVTSPCRQYQNLNLSELTKNARTVLCRVWKITPAEWVINKPQPTPAPQPNQDPTPTPVPQPNQDPAPTPKPQPTPVPEPGPAPAQELSADEQKMLDLVNKERSAQGLKPLQVDMQLVKLARMKSQDMINKGYFDHQSPTYGSPFDMMKNNGISYRYAGENIAGNSSVEKAHTSLMNSSGHRANILSPNFTHIGIGIVDGGPYGKMFTQMFTG